MSSRPDKIDWGNANVTEPSVSKKANGYNVQEKPPREYFNWFQNIVSLWQFYFGGQSQELIVISSNADEQDYATLAAYIADAPAAGDKVLIKETQALTAQMVIPDDITLRILDGVLFTRSTLDAASVIELGSNWIIEGILNLVLSQTGTTAKAIEIDGDNGFGDIVVENSSTGTLTDAFAINAGKVNNHIRGIAKNSGGGALTNVLTDSSASDSNDVVIANNATGEFARSDGAKAFRDGLEFDLSSDANGDTYYRDAGVLKRLAKGTDGEILQLASGIPSWEEVANVSVRDIVRNLVIQNTVANPTFQLDIDADEILLQDSTGLPFRATSVNETADITASGINGLDTGSEASDTWYHVFAIAKADGTVDSLLSLSATAPTMPSGYTFKAYIGAIYNDSGSDFINIYQQDDDVRIKEIIVLTSGVQTTPTAIDLSAIIPLTAKEVTGIMSAFRDIVTITLSLYAYINSIKLGEQKALYNGASAGNRANFNVMVVSNEIYYDIDTAANNGVGNAWVTGWKF